MIVRRFHLRATETPYNTERTNRLLVAFIGTSNNDKIQFWSCESLAVEAEIVNHCCRSSLDSAGLVGVFSSIELSKDHIALAQSGHRRIL
jgi:hypothetical protein